MPEPGDGETRDEFIKRCVPIVIDDGTAADGDQAVAVCSSIWRRAHEPKGKAKMEFSNPIQISEFKAAGDDWLVEGYVSTFGTVDLGHDMVMPGAFKETLKGGPKVRFLLSHDPAKVLGVPKKLKEDEKGLFGSFKISKTQLGEETHQLLLDGAIDSFSIGYAAIDWAIVDEDVRQLKKLDLYETSLVAIPMNQDAVVTNVKKNIIGNTMTLAEKTNAYAGELKKLFTEIRGLVDKDHLLNEAKRQELMELLETFSGLDDVRSELQSILATAPPKLVSTRLTSYLLAEARKRNASILKE